MRFNKIICVDNTRLKKDAIRKLQDFAKDVEVYSDYPEKDAVIKRIGDAEAVVLSWHTEIDKEIIESCPNLKYIGMACSLYDDESANVAVKFARKRGITVKGIRDYGDPGVAEFVISEIIQLLNGYKEYQWKEIPRELTGVKMGIIGFGVTGQLLAECLLPFGADLYYFSRSEKKEWHKKGIKYLSLNDLLKTCDIISFHLPRNTVLMGEKEFESFGNQKILINTSLGLPFNEASFQKWIENKDNFAIFDGDGKKELSEESLKKKGVITAKSSAGWSSQTIERLSEKVLQNILEYCKE